jgi:hypothetical protein
VRAFRGYQALIASNGLAGRGLHSAALSIQKTARICDPCAGCSAGPALAQRVHDCLLEWTCKWLCCATDTSCCWRALSISMWGLLPINRLRTPPPESLEECWTNCEMTHRRRCFSQIRLLSLVTKGRDLLGCAPCLPATRLFVSSGPPQAGAFYQLFSGCVIPLSPYTERTGKP